jgi:catechol 2,3-dioxygenase
MNVWHSAGAGPRAASLGLGDVAVSVPAREDLDALIGRLKVHAVSFTDDGRAVRVDDPWGTQVTVAVVGTTVDELLA